MKQFVETSQGKVAILDSQPKASKGTPTVVFIHGHCANKSFFAKQTASPLFANYRLICLDLPGYGDSEPPKDAIATYNWPGFARITAEVITHLELENYVIVGWSLGGHVALEATSLLSNLKGIFIFGTPPIALSKEGFHRGFKVINPKIGECFGKGNLTESEAELFATISGYDHTPSTRFIVEAILHTDDGAKTIYPKSIMKGIGQDELAIAAEWSKPIAVLGGELDEVINNDYIIQDVKFKNLWDKKIHLIPNAGHAPHMTHPTEFNDLLNRFLQDMFKPEA